MNPLQPDQWVDRFLGDSDRYRIEGSLNKGGMGDVYLATDTRLFRYVAVKLLKESLASSGEMRERFRREVALCAALDSEHIVKILDSGTSSEGFPFYVMEYLRGQSLGQLLQRERRLSAKRTVKIIRQVCAGLQLAHEGVMFAGERVRIIHRDLKPDNVFLVPTRLGELVKILDFGIAKKIRDDASNNGYTDLTNMFIGTFRYAAPEQLTVQQNIDGRADIYSLGIILYRMLTGTDPFGLGSGTRPVSELAWAQAHVFKSPYPLRSHPACEQLTPQLESVVMMCLQKSPGDRFASVKELQQALDAAISAEIASQRVRPSEAHRPSTAADPNLRRALPVTPNESAPTVIDSAAVTQAPSVQSLEADNWIEPRAPDLDDPLTVLQPLPVPPEAVNPVAIAQIPSAPENPIAQTREPEQPDPKPQNPSEPMYQATPAPAQRTAWQGLRAAWSAFAVRLLFRSPQIIDELCFLQSKADYQTCMAKAGTVPPDSVHYQNAQQILNECRLAYARVLGQSGRVQEAIAIVSRIPETSPLYALAQAHIHTWKRL